MKEDKLSLNDFAIEALRESAKWCMFLAIVGFIFIGLMIVIGAFMAVAMSAMPTDPYGGGMGMNPFAGFKAYFGIIYIVLAALYFMPIYYLYNYAKGTKQAIESGNSEVLSNALVNLKSHHKFLGIMTIIMLAVYFLTFVIGIIFAAKFAGAASGM